MNTSAAIAIRCYDKPSADGLVPRTITERLGTGALHVGAYPRLNAAAQAPPQTSEPVP